MTYQRYMKGKENFTRLYYKIKEGRMIRIILEWAGIIPRLEPLEPLDPVKSAAFWKAANRKGIKPCKK